MSRYFHGRIFLGNGTVSTQEVTALKARLTQGISELGALQQPDHPESEDQAIEAHAAREVGQQDVEDVVRDIAAALLGRSIEIGPELSYPPSPENARFIEGQIVRPPARAPRSLP